MTTRDVVRIGAVAGLVSAALPSIPTAYWMWRERPRYRWILVVTAVIVIGTAAIVLREA